MNAIERAKKDIYVEQVIAQNRQEYERKIIDIAQNHNVVDADFDIEDGIFVYRDWCRKN